MSNSLLLYAKIAFWLAAIRSALFIEQKSNKKKTKIFIFFFLPINIKKKKKNKKLLNK
jgi:hypothetical protein